MDPDRRRLAIMVDYLYGRGVSARLPKGDFQFAFSRRSGRLRLVYHGGKLFATVKPNGAMALSIYGATALARGAAFRRSCVTVKEEAVPFVRKGKSVFCKFVKSAGSNVYPRGEVAVLDGDSRVIAVGTAVMRGRFMTQFKSGVAVKVRQGSPA